MLVVAIVSGGFFLAGVETNSQCSSLSIFLSIHLLHLYFSLPLLLIILLFLLCLFHSKVLSFLMIIFIIANPNKQNKQSERKPLNTFKPVN